MSKRSRRRNRMLAALAVGLGASKLFGAKGAADAKMIKASDMKKTRVPDFIKKRGAGMDGAFLPKPPKGKTVIPESDFFGIDPFGPGMGAKKGKMIKAMGGTMVTRGQGQVMRAKKTKFI